MKNIIRYLQLNGLFILFPFLMYFMGKFMLFMYKENNIIKYTFSFLFYFFLIISVFYFVLYQTERILDFLNKKHGKLKFMFNIILIVIFLSMTFASYYWCIFDYDPCCFQKVKSNNFFETFVDFFYYSLGILLMNNNSNIEAESFFAKLLSGTEMMSAFMMLVLILANYKDLKDPFNEHLEK